MRVLPRQHLLSPLIQCLTLSHHTPPTCISIAVALKFEKCDSDYGGLPYLLQHSSRCQWDLVPLGKEALFCEGTCCKWLHRWCAGVHKDNYAVLMRSSKSFFCPSCCLSEHRQLIRTLVATVDLLKDEIRELNKGREAKGKPSTLT